MKKLAAVAVRAAVASGVASALKPSVTSDFIAGLAMSTSTDTAAAAGVVDVMPIVPGMTFICAPGTAASWDTQAEYDALVGARVLLKLTGTAAAGTATYTILAADNSTYGCVVMPLDVKKYPGKVRFAFREGCTYLA